MISDARMFAVFKALFLNRAIDSSIQKVYNTPIKSRIINKLEESQNDYFKEPFQRKRHCYLW